MSSCERDSFVLVKRLAQVGAGLAVVTVWRFVGFLRTSYTIKTIRGAPCVDVSGLRCILQQNDISSGGKVSGNGGAEVLVVVKGTVDTLVVEEGRIKSAVWGCINSVVKRFLKCLALKGSWLEWALERGWLDLPRNGLLSSCSGENVVIVQKTQSRFYVESIFSAGGWREMRSFTRSVPFVLRQSDQQSQSDYLVVNVGKPKHLLPLVTVHYHKRAINAAPCSFLQALFRRKVVSLLDEEKILPLGKEISAVGVCCLKDGVLEMKSCKNLPYFLSEMSKDEIIAHLSIHGKRLMWNSIAVGSISVVILGYAMYRYFHPCSGSRRYRRRRSRWEQQQQERGEVGEAREVEALVEQGEEGEAREVEALVEQVEEDEVRNEQCGVCLTRRREFAFAPCGHLVCCSICNAAILREMNPKCPICRQPLQSVDKSMKIYA